MLKSFLRRLPLLLANTVIALTLLCLFSWLVRENTKGKDWIPHEVSRAVTYFSTLPDRLLVAKAAVERLPLVFIPSPEDFEPINTLAEDVKVLMSYATANWKRKIVIKNIS